MLKISFLEQNKKRQHYPQKKTLTNFNLTAISKLAF